MELCSRTQIIVQIYKCWLYKHYPGPRGFLNNPPMGEIRAAKNRGSGISGRVGFVLISCYHYLEQVENTRPIQLKL